MKAKKQTLIKILLIGLGISIGFGTYSLMEEDVPKKETMVEKEIQEKEALDRKALESKQTVTPKKRDILKEGIARFQENVLGYNGYGIPDYTYTLRIKPDESCANANENFTRFIFTSKRKQIYKGNNLYLYNKDRDGNPICSNLAEIPYSKRNLSIFFNDAFVEDITFDHKIFKVNINENYYLYEGKVYSKKTEKVY